MTLHRDSHIQVVDKPCGILVEPARGAGTSLASETGLRACHRLDRDTSGCLVMARSPLGLRVMSEAFAEGRIHKEYLAVVIGSPPESGEIDLPVGEWKRGRVSTGKGRPAKTRFEVRWRQDGRAGILAVPLTGRTHQIRAHLSSLGFPILGDPTYGGPEADRLYLHAWRIDLPWPGPADHLVIEAPIKPGFLGC